MIAASQTSNLKLKISTLTCPIVAHESQNIVTICFHPDCPIQQKGCCFSCIDDHKDHQDKLVKLPDIASCLNNYYTQGTFEIQSFMAFQAQFNAKLKETEHIINEKAIQNPLKQLDPLKDLNIFDHNNLNDISRIFGKEAFIKNSKIEFMLSNQQKNLQNQFAKILGGLDQIIQIQLSGLDQLIMDAKNSKLAAYSFEGITKNLRCKKQDHQERNVFSLCFEQDCIAAKEIEVCDKCFINHKHHNIITIIEIDQMFNSIINGTKQHEVEVKFCKFNQQLKKIRGELQHLVNAQISGIQAIEDIQCICENQKITSLQLNLIVKLIKRRFVIDQGKIELKESNFTDFYLHMDKVIKNLEITHDILQKGQLKFSAKLQTGNIGIIDNLNNQTIMCTRTVQSMQWCLTEQPLSLNQITNWVLYILFNIFEVIQDYQGQWLHAYWFNTKGFC